MTYTSHIKCLFAINCYFVDTLDKNKNVCLNTFLDPIMVCYVLFDCGKDCNKIFIITSKVEYVES